MSCILTILTIMSVFNGNQWVDVEVSTKSRFTTMNEQVSSKIEFLTEDIMKTETVSVKCGENVYSTTTSTLTED